MGFSFSRLASRCIAITAIHAAAAALAQPVMGPQPSGPGQPAPDAAALILEEVSNNVLDLPIGPGTLRDHALKPDFVRRIADRAIRQSFHERYRFIEGDPIPPTPGGAWPAPFQLPPAVTLLERPDAAERAKTWLTYPVDRPPNRAFRTPLLAEPARAAPFALDPAAWDDRQRAAADYIARHLAFDGLGVTLAQALALSGPERFVSGGEPAIRALEALGYPADFLRYLAPPDAAPGDAAAVIAWTAGRLSAGEPVTTVAEQLRALPFTFTPTQPRFRVALESGEQPIGLVRLQVSRPDEWLGPGSGSAPDMARALIAALPESKFMIHCREAHAAQLIEAMNSWPLGESPARLTLSPEKVPVAQWAQDNGKAGALEPTADQPRRWATIVPRYTGRGEGAARFMAGESQAMESLAATDHAVIHSPLLFEGGNVLATTLPDQRTRVLFVGEAEIARNVALGLTPDQAAQAFAAEFGVDRVEVLPAVSFHLDFEVTFRAVEGGVAAFVNDPVAGARLVLSSACTAVERSGVGQPGVAGQIRALLEQRDDERAIAQLGDVFSAAGGEQGNFPRAFSRHFATGPAERGPLNLRRVFVALDILTAAQADEEGMRQLDRHARAYLQSWKRHSADRAALERRLAALGYDIIRVPGISADVWSITAINGVHDRTAYLMPAIGGLFAPFDEAVAAVIGRALGPRIRIVPIPSGETMLREGGVHCAASAYPLIHP